MKLFMCGDYEFLTKMYGCLEQVVCDGVKIKCTNIASFMRCYPCLYCLVYNKNIIPLSVRGRAPSRTFEAICAEHQHYIASEADKKQAKHFHNCFTEPIFNIPISQVGILASGNVRHDHTCIHTHTHTHTTHTHTHAHTHTHTHTHNAKVCPPGLHITLDVFTKLYGLLEEAQQSLQQMHMCH